ncbi:MAG: hypothetical protein R6U28_03545 [Cyclonatronaceae bacterium]
MHPVRSLLIAVLLLALKRLLFDLKWLLLDLKRLLFDLKRLLFSLQRSLPALKRLLPAFSLLPFVLIPASLQAQTCSCAGAPLLSSQGSGVSAAGSFLAGITYEYHDISSLYNGTTRLEDATVTRSTQSALLEMSYGITDRLSISGTFSWVDKQRTTGRHTASGGTTVTTQGTGDGIFMLRHLLIRQTLWNPYYVAAGAGFKAPIGTTSLKRNGFTMNADMQPGTGSWDGVFWASISRSILPDHLSAFVTGSFRRTGSNERFAENDRYRFGNEMLVDGGVSGALAGILSHSILLQYRTTDSDTRNGISLPNTGGTWISVVPVLNIEATERFSFRLSGRLPVYQDLNGTQPTTSFALSGSFFIHLNRNNNTGFGYGTPQ